MNINQVKDIVYSSYINLWTNIIKSIGFTNAIKFKSFMTFISGIVIGILIALLFISYFSVKVQKVKHLGRVTTVIFQYKNEVRYYTRVNNFIETLEFYVKCAFFPMLFFGKSAYLLEDKKRPKIFCVTLYLLLIIYTIGTILIILCPLDGLQYLK